VTKLDHPADPPEGMRAALLQQADESDPAPPPAETYAEHMANLRESIGDMHGGRTRPAREALKEIATRHGLPLEAGE
jgi:hypothetical protein